MVLMHDNAAVELLMLILELCYLFYRCYWATGTATGAPGAATAASGAGTVAATAATGAVTTASGVATGAIPNAATIPSYVRRLLEVFLFFLLLYYYSRY